jgi:hypothetical protein
MSLSLNDKLKIVYVPKNESKEYTVYQTRNKYHIKKNSNKVDITSIINKLLGINIKLGGNPGNSQVVQNLPNRLHALPVETHNRILTYLDINALNAYIQTARYSRDQIREFRATINFARIAEIYNTIIRPCTTIREFIRRVPFNELSKAVEREMIIRRLEELINANYNEMQHNPTIEEIYDDPAFDLVMRGYFPLNRQNELYRNMILILQNPTQSNKHKILRKSARELTNAIRDIATAKFDQRFPYEVNRERLNILLTNVVEERDAAGYDPIRTRIWAQKIRAYVDRETTNPPQGNSAASDLPNSYNPPRSTPSRSSSSNS